MGGYYINCRQVFTRLFSLHKKANVLANKARFRLWRSMLITCAMWTETWPCYNNMLISTELYIMTENTWSLTLQYDLDLGSTSPQCTHIYIQNTISAPSSWFRLLISCSELKILSFKCLHVGTLKLLHTKSASNYTCEKPSIFTPQISRNQVKRHHFSCFKAWTSNILLSHSHFCHRQALSCEWTKFIL